MIFDFISQFCIFFLNIRKTGVFFIIYIFIFIIFFLNRPGLPCRFVTRPFVNFIICEAKNLLDFHSKKCIFSHFFV